MKIVFLSDDFPPEAYGGAGIVAKSLADGLTKLGHEITVITTTRNRARVGEKQENNIRIITIYSNGGERFRAYRSVCNSLVVFQVGSILHSIKPDIVHAHNVHDQLSFVCLPIARLYSHKVFLTAHDLMTVGYGKLFPNSDGSFTIPSPWQQFKEQKLRYNPFRNIIIKYCLSFTDSIFTVSEALRLVLASAGLPRLIVLHNGIEVSLWQVDQTLIDIFRQAHHIEGKKVITFGGRVSGAKGSEVALSILNYVCQSIPNAVLLLVGREGDSIAKLRNKAESLGLSDKIIVTGWLPRKDMPVVYGASDVVIVPSLYLDPFPTVVLEAMASNKPVVGTCFGGTKEVIIDNTTGFVVDPRNYHLIAEKVLSLLTDDTQRERFGQAGKIVVEKNFTLDDQVQKLLALYGSI